MKNNGSKKLVKSGKFWIAIPLVGLCLLTAGHVSADELSEGGTDIVEVATATDESLDKSPIVVPNNDVEIAEPSTAMLRPSNEGEPIPTGFAFRTAQANQAVSNTTEATIETVGSPRADQATMSYTITTHLTEPAREGSYVEYHLDNLPESGLNGKQLVDGNTNTVIGTLSKVSVVNSRSKVHNNQEFDTLEKGGISSVYRAVFNSAVTDLENVSYSIGVSNTVMPVTYSDEAWTLVSKISSNGQVVATTESPILAVQKEAGDKTFPYESSSTATNNDGVIDGTRLNFNIKATDEKPLQAGDKLTLSLSNDGGIIFDTTDLTVGKVVTVKDVGSYNDSSRVNPNHVVYFNTDKHRLEIVSASEKEVVYKVLDDFPSADARYGGLAHKFIITDDSVVDTANNRINLQASGRWSKADGSDDYTWNNPTTIPIQGAKVSATGVRVPRANVYVEHVAEDGTVLSAKTTVLANVKIGTAYETQSKSFDGYELVSNPDNAQGNSGKEDITVRYVYRVANTTLTVNHVDESGAVLSPSESKTVRIGEAYQTESKTIEDYVLTATPTNATGNAERGGTVVTYVYRLKAGQVVAKYVDEQGETISESVTLSGTVKEDYSTEKKVVSDYDFVSVTGTEQGRFKEGVQEVVYTYRLKAGQVVAKYVDEQGETISESVTLSGTVKEDYRTEKKVISDYDFVSVTGTEQGRFKEGVQEVVYTYRLKTGHHVVKYEDEFGKSLLEEVVTKGSVKDRFSSIAKDIKHYTLLEDKTKGLLSGHFTTEGTETIFVYRLNKGKVIVEYVDEDGNDLNNGKLVIEGGIGFDYKTDKLTFDGYEFVEVRGTAEGQFEEGDKVVTYVYKKLLEPMVTETPEPLKPEAPKEPKQPEPTPTPKPAPEVEAPKNVLPKTGDTGSLLAFIGTALSGLGLVGLKRKKD